MANRRTGQRLSRVELGISAGLDEMYEAYEGSTESRSAHNLDNINPQRSQGSFFLLSVFLAH